MLPYIDRKETRGIVSRVAPGKVWVTLSGACSPRRSCDAGCGACGGTTAEQKIVIDTPAAAGHAPGEIVFLSYYSVNELVSALIIFGIPLAGMIGGAILGSLLSSSAAESVVSIAAAGAGLIGGFCVVTCIDRWFRKRYPSRLMPFPPGESAIHLPPEAPCNG